MIALIVSVLQWLVAGLAIALALEPSLRPRRLIGTAFLLGSGAAAFSLLLLSLIGVRWSGVAAAGVLGAAILAIWFGAARRRSRRVSEPLAATSAADRWVALGVDLFTVTLAAGHLVYTTLSPIAEWDFWAIWGLKGKLFIERGGVDWGFLEHPFNSFSHPDYPILLPLDYAWVTLFGQQWEDRWIGALTSIFGIALLLIFRELFEEETKGRTMAALATLAIASFALSTWVGMAEAPLIAFGGAGLLTLRRGLLRDDHGSIALGAVLLGFAAFTKNEGLTLMVAAGAGTVFFLGSRWREAWRLWPAAAVAAPWLVLRFAHGLHTDLTSGPVGERAARQIENFPELTRALADNLPDRQMFWIAVVAAILFFITLTLRTERFLTVAVVVQVLFYIGAYVVTPNEIRWHVASSWVRLLEQVAVPCAFIALSVVTRILEGREPVGYSSA